MNCDQIFNVVRSVEMSLIDLIAMLCINKPIYGEI